jgi:prepilin peptidase CpaA
MRTILGSTDMDDLKSFFTLASMLVTDPRSAALIVLLVTAAVIDVRSYRIPNWLTYSGTLFGLAYSAFVPFWPHHAFLWALGGCALGMVILFPMWMLRILGAGDVKLMAMAGALLGVDGVLTAMAGSLITGGVFALMFALRHRKLGQLFGNLGRIVHETGVAAVSGNPGGMVATKFDSVGKLPYGTAIAAGTIGTVVARHFGYL